MNEYEKYILAICQTINDTLQINIKNFGVKMLTKKSWYLQVLQILYPYLSDQLAKLVLLPSDELAIDRLLVLLAEEEIIEKDFLEIKGKDMVAGDIDSIFYIVQLLNALVDRALDDGVDYYQYYYDEKEEEYQYNDSKYADSKYYEYSKALTDNKIVQTSVYFKLGKPVTNELQAYDNSHNDVVKIPAYEEYVEVSERECQSVLGIGNEFEDGKDDEDFSEDGSPSPSKFEEPSANYTKMLELEHKTEYPGKQVELKSEIKSKSYEEDDHYLQYKLEKQKDNEKKRQNVLRKEMKSGGKYTEKKQYVSPKVRKLVGSPTPKKNYRRAANEEAVYLTRKVKKYILRTQNELTCKKSMKQMPKYGLSPDQFRNLKKAKYRYLDYKLKEKLRKPKRPSDEYIIMQNEAKTMKALNWKYYNFKREKKEFEYRMKQKVQLKREKYVQTINKLIIDLEKNKMQQERKDFKEKLLRENALASKKMTALEKNYRDQLDMLSEYQVSKRAEEKLMHTGHREIVKQIEKTLKRENESKLALLVIKYKQQYNEIEDDLNELTDKIVKVYNKN